MFPDLLVGIIGVAFYQLGAHTTHGFDTRGDGGVTSRQQRLFTSPAAHRPDRAANSHSFVWVSPAGGSLPKMF